ncbi:hypothetical protein SETIT_3G054800v2 [Setaria italica]|uniref:Uncharacterized protein n=1 Tax=Setaria italica TaxID=4555 RepID=A0A368QDS6_SETIT|nr:uncharacterized protein LOC101770644 [Setaria italica]XP_012699804.1 uncharacterized protein LOC101770644 [Setaria italica]RCV15418.1 hypothetical protein SETIT_3G054800v2 [Setaria italica]RCV15419.1 hypothetical protein SETIT_3G054800v2 [Setaria italica]RCV15420.1 hypothetical protein SETIT_3G054800v2 [Setaria italica]
MSSPPALVSSPAVRQLPPWRPFRRRLVPRLACASRTSCELARGASVRYRQQPQPRLVAAQSHHPPALAAVGSVRRDAETGLALLLLVLAAVMSCFLSLTILSFSACRALHKLETAANKLAKLVAEEAPGTLSLLKLSFLEVNDLTSQLKNLRKSLTISRFGKQASTKASSRT